jgi:hypothetical protein
MVARFSPSAGFFEKTSIFGKGLFILFYPAITKKTSNKHTTARHAVDLAPKEDFARKESALQAKTSDSVAGKPRLFPHP